MKGSLALHDTVFSSRVFLIHDNALQWRWKLVSDSNKNNEFRYMREKFRLYRNFRSQKYIYVRKEEREIRDALLWVFE